MYVTLSIVLGVVAIALAVIVYLRHRAYVALEAQTRRLEEIVSAGRFEERLEGDGETARFTTGANAALEQIELRDRRLRERELGFDVLLGTLNEAVAIHRDKILFANARFAALTGAAGPRELVGHRLAQLVAPEYAELVEQQVRSVLSGSVPMTRVEIELRVDRGKAMRFELSSSRIDYRGQPAVVVSLIDMAPQTSAS